MALCLMHHILPVLSELKNWSRGQWGDAPVAGLQFYKLMAHSSPLQKNNKPKEHIHSSLQEDFYKNKIYIGYLYKATSMFIKLH